MPMKNGDSVVGQALESLCLNNGWSYGVFWGFDQRNSLLLTMGDAYYEAQMGVVIDNMLLQVHMLGDGLVGQAAFTKRHQWIFVDDHGGGHNVLGCLQKQDIFMDDPDIHCQFSSGIKTIAIISVEPCGVVQFGSTQKIPERMDFVDQTKRMFREIKIGNSSMLSENIPSSSYSGLSELVASLLSTGNPFPWNQKSGQGASSRNYMRTPCSSTDLPYSSPFTHGTPLQLARPEAPFKFSNIVNTMQEQHLQSTSSFNFSTAPSPSISTGNSGQSILTSTEQQLPSQRMFMGSKGGPTTFQGLFQAGDFTITPSNFCSLDKYSLWIDPTPGPNHHNQLATPFNENVSQARGITSILSGLNGAQYLTNTPVSHPSNNSVKSSFTIISNTEDDQKFLNGSGVEKLLFDSLGAGFEWGQAENFLDDILMPEVSGGHLDFSTDNSEFIPGPHVGSSTVNLQGSLFSKLGLPPCLDDGAVSANSVVSSGFGDELSSASKRRMETCSVGGDKMQPTSSHCSGGNTNSMQPIHKPESVHDRKPKNDVILKSEEGSYIDDSYSITCGSSVESQPRKSKESAKVSKKRAKPGSRPEPKDRRQIRERLMELRKLIPNGPKMSIDSLLAQTIKHMLFLQSVTKHAEELKQAHAEKTCIIDQDREAVLRQNFYSGDCTMLTSEGGAQAMVDPVHVKDLRLPGQKLIQMLCEEKGFFLEIVNIIQGFGLTILKGVMEVKENKIWACFIVEAEENMHVTKEEIYMFLHQFLYQKGTSETSVTGQIADVLSERSAALNNYHQSLVSLPINLSQTRL
ncbi:hypothetical protein NMG60_11030600 [Bertholletia excelsa]